MLCGKTNAGMSFKVLDIADVAVPKVAAGPHMQAVQTTMAAAADDDVGKRADTLALLQSKQETGICRQSWANGQEEPKTKTKVHLNHLFMVPLRGTHGRGAQGPDRVTHALR